jgi:hypothetical protein
MIFTVHSFSGSEALQKPLENNQSNLGRNQLSKFVNLEPLKTSENTISIL